MRFDKETGTDLWETMMRTEIQQLVDYATFDDKVKYGKQPDTHKLIFFHPVFDFKYDFRHKTRMAVGDHMTDLSKESTYSRVLSLRGL